MGIFSNINEAQGSEGGLYLQPGNYVLRINRCKMVESHKGAAMFVVETEVVSSDHETIKKGSVPSYVVKMGGEYPKLALGNVADFMRAALAAKADASGVERPADIKAVELDEATADAITGETNLCAGVFLKANAFTIKTKKNTDFTRVSWDVPDDLPQLIASAA